MNTSEINECMANTDGFVGTFPCNMIPAVEYRPAYYVINTARLTESDKVSSVVGGKHWVAIMMTSGGSCEYFDSYGTFPNQPEILDFVSNNCSKMFKHNTRMLQDPSSKVCGVYCVDYLLSRSSGMKLESYWSKFTHDVKRNDVIVVDRVTCQLSALRPSLLLKIKALLN